MRCQDKEERAERDAGQRDVHRRPDLAQDLDAQEARTPDRGECDELGAP
jgi:hypothetical protein